VDVVEPHAVDGEVLDVRDLDRRRVLHAAVRRQEAVLDRQVRAREHRPEVVEGHSLQGEDRVDAGVRHREEVRVSVELAASRSEHDRLRVDRGGVDALGRADVPDVVGPEEEVRERQRALWIGIDVGESAIVDLEEVDLQGVNVFERLLPSPLLDGDVVVVLLSELGQVQVDLRLVDLEVRNELELDELGPLHARAQAWDDGDRGVGVRVLPDRDVVERDRESNEVKVEVPDFRGVAGQVLVHRLLHGAPHRLVHEEGRDDDEENQAEEDSEELQSVLGEVESGVTDLSPERLVFRNAPPGGRFSRFRPRFRGRRRHALERGK
jgi:hypothetical protein